MTRSMQRPTVKAASGPVRALDTTRATYNSLKKRFNVGKSNVIVTPGYLRSEAVLGNQNSINFPILVNEGAQPRVTERRLGISDTFVITHLGIYIAKELGADAYPAAGAQLESFVNIYTFTGAVEQSALKALFNGNLSVKVGSITYIEAVDLFRFRHVSTAQGGMDQLAATPYGASDLTGVQNLADITPTIQFSGQEKNTVVVNLPQPVDMSAAGEDKNVAIFYATGFLCQNAAPYLNR
jgi:hypothetical protein